MEVTRLERATCCLQSNCSSQLSYTPMGIAIVEGLGNVAAMRQVEPRRLRSGG